MDTNRIKEFYSKLQFPGNYTKQSLGYHFPNIRNPFLKLIDEHLKNGTNVADIGCGSGLITNLMATRYPDSTFTALDFSNGVRYGKSYAIENQIQNVDFLQIDFLDWAINKTFDVVICQGVLHHIPEYSKAWEKIKSITKPGGKIILGLYHPWGKILKKMSKINYRNQILERDQEENPWEISFSSKKVKEKMIGFDLLTQYPRSAWHILLSPMKHSRNGGLITYVFQKQI